MLSQIQALASQLSDLWNLMDAPMEECQPFHHITRNLSLTLDEVILPGALGFDVLQQVRSGLFLKLHGLVNHHSAHCLLLICSLSRLNLKLKGWIS
jgi:hypothetical protein